MIGKEDGKGSPSREKARIHRQKYADLVPLNEQKEVGIIWLVGKKVGQTFWQEESHSFMLDVMLKSLHWSVWKCSKT